MVRVGDDFHDFVVGFAGPLASLAYLLVARPGGGAVSEAQQRCVAALAHTRRRWRDVQLTGAPEPVAVEALLGRLPRRWSAQAGSNDPAAPVAGRPGATFTPLEPLEPLEPHEPVEPQPPEPPEPDIAAVRQALWDAWLTLDPRHRVPLVFADPSVASRRLAAADVPEAFASSRRLDILEQQAIAQLHSELARNPVSEQFVPDDGELRELLAATLTERALEVTGPVDAFAGVNTEAARIRRRAGLVVAGVVVVLVAALTAMAGISTSRDRAASQAAAASASLASAEAQALVTVAPARGGDLVVGWPARGDLRDDTALSVSLRTAFAAAHPDATGQVQILLITDTPWFRVAYLTAHSRAGVLQSWFYGPPGSNTLTEGAFGYGSAVGGEGVIAEVLADTAGHAVLVVIAPPDVADVRLVDSELEEVTPGQHVSEVSHPDGIAIRDESGVYVPSLLLQVVEGSSLAWNGPVGTIQLAGSASFATGSALPRTPPAGSVPSAAPDSIPVQRGTADPGLLAAARFVMQQWQHTGELGSGGVPTVLWGGNDVAGTKIVVLRVRTLHLADLVVIAWTDRPVAEGEYLLAPDASDYPLGFAYSGLDGPRIGVLVPNGVTSVALVVDGVAQGKQPVAATGFASLPVSGQYGTLADQTFVVEMFDAAGHRVGMTPVPPAV